MGIVIGGNLTRNIQFFVLTTQKRNVMANNTLKIGFLKYFIRHQQNIL